jgi:phenylacetate-CoA ligase
LFHLTKKGRLDHIEVNVETTPRFWADAPEEQRPQLARRIEKKAKDLIGFKMAVQVVAPMTITRSEGKAKRLLDERDA